MEAYLDEAAKVGLKPTDVLLIGRIYDLCMAKGVETPGLDYLLESTTEGLQNLALNIENGKGIGLVYGGVYGGLTEKLGTVDEMTLQLVAEKMNHEKYGPVNRKRLMGMLR